jgi:hypothetical protein
MTAGNCGRVWDLSRNFIVESGIASVIELQIVRTGGRGCC